MKSAKWIDIKDDDGYDLEHFVLPTHYEKDLQRVLVPYGLIRDRVSKLAQMIAAECENPLVACCVLKGAHGFFAHLMEDLKKQKNRRGESIPLRLEFIKVKSYENDQSTGNVTISLSEEDMQAFKGKDLLIVEDIVDTGKTMVALIERLKQYNPASIRVVSLLLKKTDRSNKYVPDYVGFAIPDLFVVGYCLDYNEHFRDLDHIAVISDHGKTAYAE
ncbi:hypoxanthine phosphoribosyltransferase [Spizellomyces punctatus DAOM BR117]|uniref:Hypoxanthine phosphoribosyltransferase n=1 Tax=Spizellomyces punctatus (strain DAOM BR117) TaxID=645134 RepID=A0A0L0HEN9_SPIPD|nr:hypoxanthine phosphoribosyltransferase [Spizellomyces punctatus DAOM BR117]KNC99925.1 hypoxanthine phosphoribosyltransferase [Spizellomyces punctatus DAOM BR117]|eukprot:XP_016607965.1 hypoxanthine phosphoribosyltransferase [Spizellomyces punctatus DAOM BR117]